MIQLAQDIKGRACSQSVGGGRITRVYFYRRYIKLQKSQLVALCTTGAGKQQSLLWG